MAEVQIRCADAADSSAIHSVLARAFAEYRPLYTDGGFDATVLPAVEIEKRMREGPVWVATIDGAIVGTVAAVSRGEALYIRGMAIVSESRGNRIGQRLLAEIEKYASANGHPRLTLSTTPFLGRAIRLYERAGFRRTADGDHDLFGTPLFTMEKTLHS
jgi:GNAT superfamily N-acetyltransferase